MEVRLRLLRNIAVWLCGVEASPNGPVSEVELHDAFDAVGFSYGDDLFGLLARVFESPASSRLLGIAAERILLARHKGQFDLGTMTAGRRVLALSLMARGWLARRSRLPGNLVGRLLLAFSSPRPRLSPIGAVARHAVDERPVSVIVPVYNGYEVLTRLCESLFAHTNEMHTIIFVNDASPDARIAPYLAELAQRHANVRVETMSKNAGFPAAVNRGAELCDGDFVMLNTDTEVPDGWIPRLFAPIWEDRRVASVMPLSCEWPSSGKYCVGVVAMDKMDEAGLEAVDGAIARILPDRRFNVSQCNLGFCLAVSRSAWRKVGCLASEVYGFGYCEEADWCAKARYVFGYEHRIAANLFVAHRHNGSFSSDRKKAQLERNTGRLRSRFPMRAFDADRRCAISRRVVEDAAKLALREGGILNA